MAGHVLDAVRRKLKSKCHTKVHEGSTKFLVKLCGTFVNFVRHFELSCGEGPVAALARARQEDRDAHHHQHHGVAYFLQKILARKKYVEEAHGGGERGQ